MRSPAETNAFVLPLCVVPSALPMPQSKGSLMRKKARFVARIHNNKDSFHFLTAGTGIGVVPYFMLQKTLLLFSGCQEWRKTGWAAGTRKGKRGESGCVPPIVVAFEEGWNPHFQAREHSLNLRKSLWHKDLHPPRSAAHGSWAEKSGQGLAFGMIHGKIPCL
jgi:hypothetical protein